MRHPTLLLVALALAMPGLVQARDTRVPQIVLQQAEQLRDRAMADDTGWQIV